MPAIVRNLQDGQAHELGDMALIGRSADAGIHLDDRSVSRQHAAIRFEDQHYWVIDLGSANGTFINGVALTAARVLNDGDRLQVGKSVLVFENGAALGTGSVLLTEKTQVSRVSPEPLRSVPVTILVADLKGFTAICEGLSAGEVADLLREWYADCEVVLKRNGASIDKFIGDCVFAYWHGTETEIRASALKAAEELCAVSAVPVSAARLDLQFRTGISLDCRVGMHLGQVSVGTMGKGISTALGDAVNMAFRIEGLTRIIERSIAVSAAFLDGWPQGAQRFESCGQHTVKGYKDTIEVFAPIGDDGPTTARPA
jgi:adenylate cyclase